MHTPFSVFPPKSTRAAVSLGSAMKRSLCKRMVPHVAAAVLVLTGVAPAWAQAEPFLGQLTLFPYNFCPRGWASAEGQLMSISQNTALFSLLGTTFGGNGQTTFALPDLRGRAPIGQGQGPGLSPVTLGEVAGAETVTLTSNQMPAHAHPLVASTLPATVATPGPGTSLAQTMNAGAYVEGVANPTTMAPQSIGLAGGSQPVGIRTPYLGMRWCIAFQGGVFPSPN